MSGNKGGAVHPGLRPGRAPEASAAVTAPPAKPGASEECEPLKAALRNRKRFLCAP